MSVFNLDIERVHVARDIIPEESTIIDSRYFNQLRGANESGFIQHLHATILSNREVQMIGDKYPTDHPRDLIIEALGDLQLPEVRYAHIEPAEVFGGGNGVKGPRHYVASPLDREGARRLQEDAAKLLGYFGLERIRNPRREHRPHVSFMRLRDSYDYAQYQVSAVNKVIDEPKPVAFSHPIVEHHRFTPVESAGAVSRCAQSAARYMLRKAKTAASLQLPLLGADEEILLELFEFVANPDEDPEKPLRKLRSILGSK